jgi:hypothetical protein
MALPSSGMSVTVRDWQTVTDIPDDFAIDGRTEC